MSYSSDVRIIMGRKSYELLKNNCINNSNTAVKSMVERPSFINFNAMYADGDTIKRDGVYIGWDWIEWYYDYPEVKAVMDTLAELDDIVEKDSSNLKKYFYKFLSIGEDGASDEVTNDPDYLYTADYEVISKFSIDK